MARRLAALAALSVLATSSNAFKIVFHLNDQCAGAGLGNWVGGSDQGCRQEFAGQAESVSIISTGEVDDGYTVKFYNSENCNPAAEIARADGGCLTVDNAVVQGYKSFQVVSASFDTPTTKKPQAAIVKKPRAPNGRMGLAKREQASAQPNITHGLLASFDGIEYKWQQVTANGWIGILPDQWDDSIHVANTEELEVDPELAREIDLMLVRRSAVLEDRGLVQDACRAFASCISTAQNGAQTVKNAVRPWAIQVGSYAVTKGKKLNEILNDNPFVANLVIQVGATTAQLTIGGKTSGDNDNIGECAAVAAGLSEQAKQIEALASAVESLAAAISSWSLTSSIQDERRGEDSVSTLSVATLNCGELAPTTGCRGIDAGFCVA